MMDNTIEKLQEAKLFPQNIYRTDHSTTMQVYMYGIEVDIDLGLVNGEYSYTLFPPGGQNPEENIVNANFVFQVMAFARQLSGFDLWKIYLYGILNSGVDFEIVRHSCVMNNRTLKLRLLDQGGNVVNFMIRNYGGPRFAYMFSAAGLPNRVDGSANELDLGMNPNKILRILREVFGQLNAARPPLVPANQPTMSMLESLSQRLDELILAS